MASDRQQFRAALDKWDQQQADAHFSVPPNQGELAIVLPYDHARHAESEKVETFAYLAAQTLRFVDHTRRQTGKTPHLALDATLTDFKEIATNPHISDVIVVGKGSFSGVEIAEPTNWLGWQTVSELADHLKTGRFQQLVCGSRPNNLNVPFGAFMTADHRSVFAPIDTYLPARSSLARLATKLCSVTDQPRMDWQYIKDHFSTEIAYTRTDLLRARADRIERHIRTGTFGLVVRRKLARTVDTLTSSAANSQPFAEPLPRAEQALE